MKLDDGFWSNPKIMALGNEAAGVYTRMLSYCGQHLTDGHVADEVAKLICSKGGVFDKLKDSGLIERNGAGWIVSDFLEFNPSREQVENERRSSRERMRKLRANKR